MAGLPWFRFYRETLNDPIVQSLPAAVFKAWVNLLCVASERDGVVPDAKTTSLLLRSRTDRTTLWLQTLTDRGLIVHAKDGTWRIADWGERQYKSDTSKDRVRRHRAKSDGRCNVTGAVTVTAPDTESDSERESETKKEVGEKESTQSRARGNNAPGGAPPPSSPVGDDAYFEEGAIRIPEADVQKWEKEFSHIEVRAELRAMATWAAKVGGNRSAILGALRKANQAANERTAASAKAAREAGEPERELITWTDAAGNVRKDWRTKPRRTGREPPC